MSLTSFRFHRLKFLDFDDLTEEMFCCLRDDDLVSWHFEFFILSQANEGFTVLAQRKVLGKVAIVFEGIDAERSELGSSSSTSRL